MPRLAASMLLVPRLALFAREYPDVVLQAALDGVGVAFTFESQVAPLVAKRRLVRVLEDWCPPWPGYFIYYPSRRHQPPGLSALIETLR